MFKKVVAARREARLFVKNKGLSLKVPNSPVVGDHRLSWRCSNFMRILGDFVGAFCLFTMFYVLLQFLPLVAEVLK